MLKNRRDKKLKKLIDKINSMKDFTVGDKMFCYRLHTGKTIGITYHDVNEEEVKDFIKEK